MSDKPFHMDTRAVLTACVDPQMGTKVQQERANKTWTRHHSENRGEEAEHLS